MIGADGAKSSFPPEAGPGTRLLILGSLPGEVSLARGQYYAHPQNQFWRLVGAVIDADLAGADYSARLAALVSHSARMRGTGNPIEPRADITRYSRSTWCALASSWPGGFLRMTQRFVPAVNRKVGFDAPRAN